jgi:hypothetical protein
MDHLVERPPVRARYRRERPVGGIAERDEVGAEAALWKPEERAGEILVEDRGVSAPDAQVSRLPPA